jgi:death on curing protein
VTEYPTTADVLAVHEDQIAQHGGSLGLRDPGALESALYRPQTGYYKDLVEEAAALWESLSHNHPFVDGNKRTSFIVAITFLTTNGYGIGSGADEDSIPFVTGLYERHEFRFESLVKWLHRFAFRNPTAGELRR